MKKIFGTLLLSNLIISGFAQNQTAKIVLSNNQQLQYTSTVNGNISQEMAGQTMEVKMDVATKRKITVTAVTPQNYNLNAVNTHMKMNLNMMGQDKSFDSDNKDDMAGDMKDAGKNINVVNQQFLSITGKCTAAKKDSSDKNATDPGQLMMANIMGGGTEEITTESYFMLIPQGIKVGGKWTDSMINPSSKAYWNYTWVSDSANFAIIKAIGKTSVVNTMNIQGMDIKVNLTSDINEDRKVDIKTGIVITKKSTTDMSGSMEVMGQNVPMSGNVVTVISKVE